MNSPAEPYPWKRQWTETVRWHKKVALISVTPVGMGRSLAERLRRDDAVERSVSHVDPPLPCSTPATKQAARASVGFLYEVGGLSGASS